MSSEKKRIEKILELFELFPVESASGHHASTGVKHLDDCAVIPISPEIDLVVGSDFVRGEGFDLFRLGHLDWKDIGYYLISANASDLAAMGAAPVGVCFVFRTTASISESQYNDVLEGVLEACRDFGMPLLGGDSGGYNASVLSASALGTCPKGRALLRRNGRAGDIVYLSDKIGNAAAASAWFQRGCKGRAGLEPKLNEALLESWRRPKPALEIGALLEKRGYSKCAIDTSDGLKAAARHLSEASALDVVLQRELIPIAPEAMLVAEKMGPDPLVLAAGDSVDFRVLFTSSPQKGKKLASAFAKRQWPLYRIGTLRKSESTPSVYLEAEGELGNMIGIEWYQSEEPTIDRLLRSQKK